jgi:hypothetical protein
MHGVACTGRHPAHTGWQKDRAGKHPLYTGKHPLHTGRQMGQTRKHPANTGKEIARTRKHPPHTGRQIPASISPFEAASSVHLRVSSLQRQLGQLYHAVHVVGVGQVHRDLHADHVTRKTASGCGPKRSAMDPCQRLRGSPLGTNRASCRARLRALRARFCTLLLRPMLPRWPVDGSVKGTLWWVAV